MVSRLELLTGFEPALLKTVHRTVFLTRRASSLDSVTYSNIGAGLHKKYDTKMCRIFMELLTGFEPALLKTVHRTVFLTRRASSLDSVTYSNIGAGLHKKYDTKMCRIFMELLTGFEPALLKTVHRTVFLTRRASSLDSVTCSNIGISLHKKYDTKMCRIFMELLTGFEPVTSSLPRKCSKIRQGKTRHNISINCLLLTTIYSRNFQIWGCSDFYSKHLKMPFCLLPFAISAF